jgi:hypothetical protein
MEHFLVVLNRNFPDKYSVLLEEIIKYYRKGCLRVHPNDITISFSWACKETEIFKDTLNTGILLNAKGKMAHGFAKV